MKIILHIGMGKTGTSSLQRALSISQDSLKSQGVLYLGMWFDMLSADFLGLQNQNKFFSLPPDEIGQSAEIFVQLLKERAAADGIHTFIMSNEALSGKGVVLAPFIAALRREFEVQIIGYVRDPAKWLPSAYVQWGIRDKTTIGAVPDFEPMARKLVNWYRGLLEWHDQQPDILDVRYYDAVSDVVDDFSVASGITIKKPEKRLLERNDPVDTLLRAIFNNGIRRHTLPSVFDRQVLEGQRDIADLKSAVDKYFDYSATDDIIADNHEIFAEYSSRFGIDLLSRPYQEADSIDLNLMRERLIDYLVDISMRQARRLHAVEQEVKELRELVQKSLPPQ